MSQLRTLIKAILTCIRWYSTAAAHRLYYARIPRYVQVGFVVLGMLQDNLMRRNLLRRNRTIKEIIHKVRSQHPIAAANDYCLNNVACAAGLCRFGFCVAPVVPSRSSWSPLHRTPLCCHISTVSYGPSCLQMTSSPTSRFASLPPHCVPL